MPEISESSKIVKTDDFVETIVDGEVVLMHLDHGKFFGLKDTGRHLWRLLDDHHQIDALVTETMKQYDVPEETCRTEIIELLSQLEERKLVTVV